MAVGQRQCQRWQGRRVRDQPVAGTRDCQGLRFRLWCCWRRSDCVSSAAPLVSARRPPPQRDDSFSRCNAPLLVPATVTFFQPFFQNISRLKVAGNGHVTVQSQLISPRTSRLPPYRFTNGGFAPKGVPQGMDGLKLAAMTPTVWPRGSEQEVGWAISAVSNYINTRSNHPLWCLHMRCQYLYRTF